LHERAAVERQGIADASALALGFSVKRVTGIEPAL
jgi:hypothetical protein